MLNTDAFYKKHIYCIGDNDLDGIVGRITSHYYLDPICNKVTYHNDRDKELSDFDWKGLYKYDIVIFIDIAPPDEEFYNKIKEDCEVYIFDHHQSSRDKLTIQDNYIFTLDKCGSKIFYDWISEGQRQNRVLDKIVYLTNIYDLYKQDHKDWKDAHGLHNSMPCYVDWRRYFSIGISETAKNENWIDAQLIKIDRAEEFWFTPKELRGIQDQINKEKKAYKDAKKSFRLRKDNEGTSYGFIEISTKTSETATRMLKEYDDIQYIAILNTFDSSSLKISLRSLNGYNTTGISELWDGGGHLAASGFKFKTLEQLQDFKMGKIHLI